VSTNGSGQQEGTPLSVFADGEESNALADLADKREQVIDVPLQAVIGLTEGTEGGKPSVMVRADLPDGRTVIAQTTLALFLAAADVLRARHGDPRT
jgi:hypothetical protein